MKIYRIFVDGNRVEPFERELSTEDIRQISEMYNAYLRGMTHRRYHRGMSVVRETVYNFQTRKNTQKPKAV